MSKVSALYHIVFNTKLRKMTIPMDKRRDLYAYIFGVIKHHRCGLIRINGIGNHIHMLVNLSPTISLSEFVATIKRSSSIWIKEHEDYKDFEGWGREYYAATISRNQTESVVQYIINQESHHLGQNFEDEIKQQMIAEGLGWDDRDLT